VSIATSAVTSSTAPAQSSEGLRPLFQPLNADPQTTTMTTTSCTESDQFPLPTTEAPTTFVISTLPPVLEDAHTTSLPGASEDDAQMTPAPTSSADSFVEEVRREMRYIGRFSVEVL
jgi:hypothetical protein